jgi:hypothetical protein
MDASQVAWNVGSLVAAIALLGLALWIPTKVTRRLVHLNRAAWGWTSAPVVPEERAGYRTGAEALEPQAEPPREVRRAAWWSFALAQTGVLWAAWIVAVPVWVVWLILAFGPFPGDRAWLLLWIIVFGLLLMGLGWLGVAAARNRARMGVALLRAHAVADAFVRMRRWNMPLQWILLVSWGLVVLVVLSAAWLTPYGNVGYFLRLIALPVAMAIVPLVVGTLHAMGIRRALAAIARRAAPEGAVAQTGPVASPPST